MSLIIFWANAAQTSFLNFIFSKTQANLNHVAYFRSLNKLSAVNCVPNYLNYYNVDTETEP